MTHRTFAALFTLALPAPLLGACAAVEPAGEEPGEPAADRALAVSGTLKLVKEKKISSILTAGTTHYEASGVQFKDGALFVVFDNMDRIAEIPTDLTGASFTSGSLSDSRMQYEGITFDSYGTQHFYVLQEARSAGGGEDKARIVQIDDQAGAQNEDYQWTDAAFANPNKGFEGIAWIRRNSKDYLLGLCEGEDCKDVTDGSLQGKIKVLVQGSSSWSTAAKMVIPAAVDFLDFSDIALYPNQDGTYKVAITSQESKKLWIGTLSATSWAFVGNGAAYDFPSPDYCSVEGVTFVSETRLSMVSDEYTDSNAPGCKKKDEMVHIFDLP